ncbi:hypothetical protein [Viscerimonas tarda]
MKKGILIIICAAISLQCCGQTQIQDKEFEKFVGKFSIQKFPINTKRIKKTFNVDNDKSNITKEEAIKFLNRTDESMNYSFELYDYEEGIVQGYKKMECIPGVLCKYNTNNFMCLLTLEGKINSNTTLIYLYTFDYKGKMINKCIIGEQFTMEDDWVSCIIENEQHFKVFWYSTNFDNYTNKDGTLYLIDKEKPLSKVIIEDYEILENGIIQKKQVKGPIYLKGSIVDYKFFHKDSDDPMNKYND